MALACKAWGADEAFLMGGLTAVPASNGDGEVLLGSRVQPGVIERIDPSADYAVTVELDIREHFAKAWDLSNYRRAALSAYNTMTPWTNPRSGEQVHLIGVAVLHPRAQTHLLTMALGTLFATLLDTTRPDTSTIASIPFPPARTSVVRARR